MSTKAKAEVKTVKAMFVCDHKSVDAAGHTTLNFSATQGKSGKESEAFNDATPYGALSMGIAAGKEAADLFEQGKSYYLTFEPAKPAK